MVPELGLGLVFGGGGGFEVGERLSYGDGEIVEGGEFGVVGGEAQHVDAGSGEGGGGVGGVRIGKGDGSRASQHAPGSGQDGRRIREAIVADRTIEQDQTGNWYRLILARVHGRWV